MHVLNYAEMESDKMALDATCDENRKTCGVLNPQPKIDTSERLLEDVIGCGHFQVLVTILVTIMAKVPAAATFMFMAFGNYNPGWRCLDGYNVTSHTNSSDPSNKTTPDYTTGSCEDYEACDHVQFNPDSSTIVTEWGLLCDRSWISSLIISLQMVGALIGSIIAGQMGDSFGRKTVVYGCIALMTMLNLVSLFSTSWQMFAFMRFAQGGAASSLIASYYVLSNEFITYKWRGPNNAVPAWNVGTIIFSLIAYFVRDWKILHLSIAMMSAVCFIPVFWVPESLRWLAVKNKSESYEKVVKKMVRLNKKPAPPSEILNSIVKKASNQSDKSKKYRVYHLLHRDFRTYTIIASLLWMTFSIIYYAISFGITNLYGDFYLNLILLFVLELPFAILPSFVPNLLGRVKGSNVFVLFAVLCILTCAGLQVWGSSTGRVAGSIIILLAKVSLNSGWCIHIMQVTELYPTVVRGLCLGWLVLMARVGGIIAPFITPSNKDDIYISCIIMAALALLCCGGIMKLPETKGRALRDNFEDDDKHDSEKHELEVLNGR